MPGARPPFTSGGFLAGHRGPQTFSQQAPSGLIRVSGQFLVAPFPGSGLPAFASVVKSIHSGRPCETGPRRLLHTRSRSCMPGCVCCPRNNPKLQALIGLKGFMQGFDSRDHACPMSRAESFGFLGFRAFPNICSFQGVLGKPTSFGGRNHLALVEHVSRICIMSLEQEPMQPFPFDPQIHSVRSQ